MIYPFKMGGFHSYLSLPQGNIETYGEWESPIQVISGTWVKVNDPPKWWFTNFCKPQEDAEKSNPTNIVAGWWFGCHEFYFPIYWECHHSNWRSYFSEGWPNHQPGSNWTISDICWWFLHYRRRCSLCFLSWFIAPMELIYPAYVHWVMSFRNQLSSDLTQMCESMAWRIISEIATCLQPQL